MITPLDIENKKFAKQMMNGYSVEEVDDFLDELTKKKEKLYKEVAESKNKMEELQENVEKYKGIESTLQNTLVMAQLAADDIKKAAQKEADKILLDAQGDARQTARALDQDIILKKKTLEDLEKQLDVYRAKMESLLISQLELLKESNKD